MTSMEDCFYESLLCPLEGEKKKEGIKDKILNSEVTTIAIGASMLYIPMLLRALEFLNKYNIPGPVRPILVACVAAGFGLMYLGMFGATPKELPEI